MTTGFVDMTGAAPVAGDATATSTDAGRRTVADRGLLVRRLIGLAVTVGGVLLLSLVVYLYGFTPLTHARDQQRLLQSLTGTATAEAKSRFALVNGSIPPEGHPLGLLHIPSIGLSQAIVEGTSAADLQAGPGHMPGTAIPGTPGNAVIAGKRVTFGGPFRHLGSLRPGDAIHVTDGLGTFTYTVRSVGTVVAGQTDVITNTTANQLTLVTSNSSLMTSGRLVVTAALRGLPVASPTALPSVIPSSELGLSGDPSAGGALLFWVELLLLVAGFTAFALWRWRRPWPTYLLASPVLLACGLFAAESFARWLPATL